VRLQCAVTCGVCKGYTQDQAKAQQAFEVWEKKHPEHTEPTAAPRYQPLFEHEDEEEIVAKEEEKPKPKNFRWKVAEKTEETTTKKPVVVKKSAAWGTRPALGLLLAALCTAATSLAV